MKRFDVLAVEVGADPFTQFGLGQEVLRFNDRALGMNPVRLNPIQPRALNRQWTDHNPHAVGLRGLTVMNANPAAHFLAPMPTSIVPYQQQGSLALSPQWFAEPAEKGGGQVTHRTALYEAHPYL